MGKNILIYNLNCKVYLLQNIELINMLKEISHMVDVALCSTDTMIKFHEENQFKNYCISGFKEIERDRIYKEGKVYSFSIRCISKEFAEFLCRQLSKADTNTMKGLVCDYKVIPHMYIDRLYTVTPAVVQIQEGGYWRNKITIDEYERLLFENSVKKYNSITGNKLDENFKLYDTITFLNKVPIKTNYKSIQLLGDKVELAINSDERAQAVAYMLLGTGALLKNSRGYGFVNYRTQ